MAATAKNRQRSYFTSSNISVFFIKFNRVAQTARESSAPIGTRAKNQFH
jgi:hypothetical protein